MFIAIPAFVVVVWVRSLRLTDEKPQCIQAVV
jgi:hypothetical protein